MNRRQAATLLRSLPLVLAGAAFGAPAGGAKKSDEETEHPKISKAIRELESAIEYMEQAPHDFGGHKADALRDSKAALEQLRKAVEFHEKGKGKGK